MYQLLNKKTIKLETLPEKKNAHISKGRQINDTIYFSYSNKNALFKTHKSGHITTLPTLVNHILV